MNKNPNNLISRPPVVVVMGHIDHGKTKLLDYIRKTNVIEKEAGGITQHIGAYEIEIEHKPSGRKITFIDTPGHEAFSKMRSRGAKVADIALLVVAADEGVKPQTIEALNHIKESNIPFIVVINKIDKPEAQPTKIKQQLGEQGVFLEGWGGNIANQEISAKTGQGIPELLDLILLVAEVAELKGDPKKLAEGVILESFLNPKRGSTATMLIKDGVLEIGDYLVTEEGVAKIKTLENFKGNLLKNAAFSSPVLITGFKNLVSPGLQVYTEKLRTIADKKYQQLSAKGKSTPGGKISAVAVPNRIFNIILKTDVGGSKEALENILDKLNFPEISLKIVKSEVGDINESDLKLATSTKSSIVGFKVKISPLLEESVQKEKINIILGEIIYDLENKVKEEMTKILPPEIKKIELGQLEVLAVFKQEPSRQIIGGKVIKGKIKKGAKIDVLRKKQKISSGRAAQLQHNKQDIEEVSQGKEAGILFVGSGEFVKILPGDILDIYEEEIIKRQL